MNLMALTDVFFFFYLGFFNNIIMNSFVVKIFYHDIIDFSLFTRVCRN